MPSHVAAIPPQSRPPNASATNCLRRVPAPGSDSEEDEGLGSPLRTSVGWRFMLLNGNHEFFGFGAACTAAIFFRVARSLSVDSAGAVNSALTRLLIQRRLLRSSVVSLL